jgi:nuclear cap-binding protein subunit 1
VSRLAGPPHTLTHGDSTVEQPLKIPFLAAIVLVLNPQKPEFTAEILKRIGDAAQKQIEAGNWREVKLFLRFLACIQGLFEGNGGGAFFKSCRFTDCLLGRREYSNWNPVCFLIHRQSLGLELVKIILYTIAYTMASSATGLDNEAAQLLDKTDIIASTPHTLENLVDPFYTGAGNDPSETQSALGLFQRHLQEEAKLSWELSCLPRPWKSVRGSEEEDPLASAQKHPFPTIAVPETLQIGPRPIYPDVYFSVYSDQDMETVPPASDITAFLVRDTLTDTINALDFNRNATAKFLIEVDCYFTPNTFVRRATPFDKLRDLAGDRPTWKPEDVAVDAAFSQLFQLPAPEHKLVYYHSVLTEACKIAPAAIAPSLGRAIRFLYRNVDRLDLELSQRFLDWFAHHLSNFGFTWKWTEW